MNPIGIAINENVVISKASINDKKRLVIELDHAEKVTAVKTSVFDSLLTAGVNNEGGSGMKLTVFGPLLPKKETITNEEKVIMLGKDLTRLRNQLTQILEQYLLLDKIDLNTLEIQFAGTGITDGATYESRILDQDILNKIYDNLVNRFVELITPFLNNAEYAVRFKLIRQSKDKHFATIPSSFIADNPFIELASIPKEQSRVKFTSYEIKEGLDSNKPIEAASAEAKAGSGAPAAAVSEVNPFAAQ